MREAEERIGFRIRLFGLEPFVLRPDVYLPFFASILRLAEMVSLVDENSVNKTDFLRSVSNKTI